MGQNLMNIGNTVNLDGEEYRINTDFRIWIKIEHLFFDSSLSMEQRLAEALVLAYPILPPNPDSAIEGILRFYSGGQNKEYQKEDGISKLPSYDLVEDFDLVWGAFKSEFGIDLTEESMHWWKFRALLASLSEDCRFLKIVGYRSVDLGSIKDKQTREFYMKMKKRFSLSIWKDKESQEKRLTEGLEVFF